MPDKLQPTEKISNIKKGSTDRSGNVILNVLVRANEYAIYEIDDKDINNRLHVFIDGHTNENEELIIKRYVKAKQKFIEAKGLLYRSTNFGMMKNRIAHTLASALSSDEINGEQEFETLIEDINNEYKKSTINRYLYITPAFVITVIASIVIFINMDWRATNYPYWQVICVIFGSSIGGSLSILAGLKKYSFDEHPTTKYYFMIGLERMFLSGLAGTIAFVGMRSGIVFQQVDVNNYWAFMLIIIAAGFSESLVPSMLNKLSAKKA